MRKATRYLRGLVFHDGQTSATGEVGSPFTRTPSTLLCVSMQEPEQRRLESSAGDFQPYLAVPRGWWREREEWKKNIILILNHSSPLQAIVITLQLGFFVSHCLEVGQNPNTDTSYLHCRASASLCLQRHHCLYLQVSPCKKRRWKIRRENSVLSIQI